MFSKFASFCVLVAIVLSSMAFAQGQTASQPITMVSSNPPYICQVQLGTTQRNAKTQDIQGNQGNSLAYQNVRTLRSQYCSCLVLAFSENNFQGRYATYKVGGNAWKNLGFLAKSLVLSCYPGLNNTAYTTN